MNFKKTHSGASSLSLPSSLPWVLALQKGNHPNTSLPHVTTSLKILFFRGSFIRNLPICMQKKNDGPQQMAMGTRFRGHTLIEKIHPTQREEGNEGTLSPVCPGNAMPQTYSFLNKIQPSFNPKGMAFLGNINATKNREFVAFGPYLFITTYAYAK